MLTYVLEFSEVDLHISSDQVTQFLHELEKRSVSYEYEDEGKKLVLSIQHNDQETQFVFKKLGDSYKLRSKQIRFSDQQSAELFQELVTNLRGHAVMKLVGPDSTVVHQIEFGEAIRITQVNGNRKKVLLDRAESVTIERVMEAFQLHDVEERIPILRIEIDEELSNLAAMIDEDNKDEIEASKKRLKKLRREMLIVEM